MIEIGDKLIIDGRRREIGNTLAWRRCRVLEGPRIRFGIHEVQVLIERRDGERVDKKRWVPVGCLLKHNDKNTKILSKVLCGKNDI